MNGQHLDRKSIQFPMKKKGSVLSSLCITILISICLWSAGSQLYSLEATSMSNSGKEEKVDNGKNKTEKGKPELVGSSETNKGQNQGKQQPTEHNPEKPHPNESNQTESQNSSISTNSTEAHSSPASEQSGLEAETTSADATTLVISPFEIVEGPGNGSADPQQIVLGVQLAIATPIYDATATLHDLDYEGSQLQTADSTDDLTIDDTNPRSLGDLAEGIYYLYWNLNKNDLIARPNNKENFYVELEYALASGGLVDQFTSSPVYTITLDNSASIKQNSLRFIERSPPEISTGIGDVFEIRTKYKNMSHLWSIIAHAYYDDTIIRLEQISVYFYDGFDPGSVEHGVPDGYTYSFIDQIQLTDLAQPDLFARASNDDSWVFVYTFRVLDALSFTVLPYIQIKENRQSQWKVSSSGDFAGTPEVTFRVLGDDDAINEVSEEHDFTFTLQLDDGSGWQNVGTGYTMDFTIDSPAYFTKNGNQSIQETTDENGQIILTVNSDKPTTATVTGSYSHTSSSGEPRIYSNSDTQKTWANGEASGSGSPDDDGLDEEPLPFRGKKEILSPEELVLPYTGGKPLFFPYQGGGMTIPWWTMLGVALLGLSFLFMGTRLCFKEF